MVIICSRCKSKLKVPVERIKPGGSKLKCPKCQFVTVVQRPEEDLASPPSPPSPPQPPPPLAEAPSPPPFEGLGPEPAPGPEPDFDPGPPGPELPPFDDMEPPLPPPGPEPGPAFAPEPVQATGTAPATGADVAGYSLKEFVQRTAQRDKGQGIFELETDRMLEVNLSGRVWTKTGSMVAYNGDITFTREGVLEHGVKKFLKKAVTGEGARLTKAEGRGKLYLADSGKKISILNLAGEAIFVNGNDLLAFEDGMGWDIKMLKKVAGMLAGGLFNVRLEGTGMIALTTHYDPLTLIVSPSSPVTTDPNATVAWSGSLTPELKTDISLKTFIGRGSGESIQMLFSGVGFVVVQPYEEVSLQRGRGR